MKILLIIFILYLFIICPRIFNKPDYIILKGWHYAHRGLFDNNTNAPENSLPAFQKAVQNGYGIELDVQLSKDDVPVVFHDKTLERMCGIKGYVWEYTLAELKEMTLADSDEKIPTFKEALSVIDKKVPFILEYKLDRVQTRVCELAEDILADYSGIYCIESFHPLALMWYRKNRPEIIRGQLCKEYWKDKDFRGKLLIPFTLLSYLVTNVVTRPDFISYHWRDYRNLSLKLCGKMGALLFAWTIRSKEEFEEIKDRFDLFIFDSFQL